MPKKIIIHKPTKLIFQAQQNQPLLYQQLIIQSNKYSNPDDFIFKKDHQIQYNYYKPRSNPTRQKKQDFVYSPDQASQIKSLTLENQTLKEQIIKLILSNEQLHNLINNQLNIQIKDLHEQLKKQEQIFQDKMREQEQSIFFKLNQLIYQENDDKGQNQLINQIKEQMQVLYPPLPFSLIVGKAGVGKTSIMKVLFDRKPTQEFKPEYLKELNSYFVDTKAFDMNTSIKIKEEQKKLYQQLFTTFPDKIANIFIVVNYERTDIMKLKISEIKTKFNKFIKMVSIIITNFDESEDPVADERELRQNLQYFQTKEIIFIKRNTTKEEMIQKLQKVMVQQNKDQVYPFDLKDTIFEILNPEELNQIMADIYQNIKL